MPRILERHTGDAGYLYFARVPLAYSLIYWVEHPEGFLVSPRGAPFNFLTASTILLATISFRGTTKTIPGNDCLYPGRNNSREPRAPLRRGGKEATVIRVSSRRANFHRSNYKLDEWGGSFGGMMVKPVADRTTLIF